MSFSNIYKNEVLSFISRGNPFRILHFHKIPGSVVLYYRSGVSLFIFIVINVSKTDLCSKKTTKPKEHKKISCSVNKVPITLNFTTDKTFLIKNLLELSDVSFRQTICTTVISKFQWELFKKTTRSFNPCFSVLRILLCLNYSYS